jgi:nicotinamide-nucleotide amidase
MMNASIVSVGNELLFGETVDTNAAWLGRALSEKGIPVVRRFTVGDVDAEIRGAVSAAMEAADVVFVSGGLGPTPDDITKHAVAALLGRGLVEDEEVRRDVEARFRAFGQESTPTLSSRQFEIPEGARALRNSTGTAPGLLMTSNGLDVVLLPGVPRELKTIFAEEVLPILIERLGGEGEVHRVFHRVVHTTGLAEPRLAEALEERMVSLPTEVTTGIAHAYLPDLHGVDLRFTIRGGPAADVERRFDRLLEEVDSVLHPWRFSAKSGDLAEAVSEELRRRDATLAVAESCTGGLLSRRITDLPGSSDVFVGGVVAYSNDVKVDHVGVSPTDLAREGAVSEVVARQLAVGVAERFGVAVGVGVTGVAGPSGGTDEKPVGTVWIGVSIDGEPSTELCSFAGDRNAVRERAAQAALAHLYRRLSGVMPRG